MRHFAVPGVARWSGTSTRLTAHLRGPACSCLVLLSRLYRSTPAHAVCMPQPYPTTSVGRDMTHVAAKRTLRFTGDVRFANKRHYCPLFNRADNKSIDFNSKDLSGRRDDCTGGGNFKLFPLILIIGSQVPDRRQITLSASNAYCEIKLL